MSRIHLTPTTLQRLMTEARELEPHTIQHQQKLYAIHDIATKLEGEAQATAAMRFVYVESIPNSTLEACAADFVRSSLIPSMREPTTLQQLMTQARMLTPYSAEHQKKLFEICDIAYMLKGETQATEAMRFVYVEAPSGSTMESYAEAFLRSASPKRNNAAGSGIASTLARRATQMKTAPAG